VGGILSPMAPPLNLADLGRRVRTARLARRLTLEEVVSRTDFTVSWLSKIENGLLAPSLEGLVRLAEVLECGVEQLVAGLQMQLPDDLGRRGLDFAGDGAAAGAFLALVARAQIDAGNLFDAPDQGLCGFVLD